MDGSGAPPIRVLVVDDHEVVRVGLRLLLGRYADLAVVGEAPEGAAAVTAVAELAPDVVLMDLSMPGMDGVAATRAIGAGHPQVRVVALTTFADRDHVTAAIDAGAVGFLLKDADPEALAAGIRAAARGEAPLDPRAALALIDRRRERPAGPAAPAGAAADAGPELTAREREVLALVGQGMSNRLIARRLGIAEKTVKAHLTSVFAQIGVTDRVQAALWWQRHRGEGEPG
ncbi:MAG: response regulator transcription factor [Candidatus Nanopelagicales bacterium]|jgi:DNA-binding NarL/FixJ family response regulator|nr:response regulator transcription factor [Candidatus Nanopelagicales bacterium]